MPNKKMLIVCGHGDGDSGAVGCGYKEAELTREVGLKVKEMLSEYIMVDIYDTTKNCYAECLKGRTPNFKDYIYVLEIHFNAGVGLPIINFKTTGTEIYVTTSEKTTVCEQFIVDGISSLGFKNRGVKRKNWTVISKAKAQGVSSALLEVCFIDDGDDMELYKSSKNKICRAIVNGIVKSFKLSKMDDLENAKSIVQSKVGLEDSTIQYMLDYEYGEILLKKIANALK